MLENVVYFPYLPREGATMLGMSFLTALFAFLLATHFVGIQLSKAQVVFLSTIYSVFSFLPAIGMYQDIVFSGSLLTEFHKEHAVFASKHYDETSPAWAIVVPSLYFVAWFGSIINIVKVRRDA